MLDALSRVGGLRHEVELSNGRRRDFELTINTEAEDVVVIGDVTAVSDAGLDEQNTAWVVRPSYHNILCECGDS
jgi:hypothetical protein